MNKELADLIIAYGNRRFEIGQVQQSGTVPKWLHQAASEAFQEIERLVDSSGVAPKAEEVVVAFTRWADAHKLCEEEMTEARESACFDFEQAAWAALATFRKVGKEG